MRQKMRSPSASRRAEISRWSVYSDVEAAYAYISEHYYLGRTQDMKGLVQTKGGKIVAAVVYDTFTTHNCFMHVASDGSKKWLTRHALHEAFKYPFVTAACERVTLWVEDDNRLMRAFAVGLGFTLEAVLERAGRNGVDVLIYRMFRQECRYA